MKDKLQVLINLGECVLETETHVSDAAGLAHVSTVTGPKCDEWKEKCKIFFKSYNGGELSEGYKLANIEIMRKSQAKHLLQILKDLRGA